MNVSFPSPKELKKQLPASFQQINFIQHTRQEIRKILNGTDTRLLMIVGPCSIHDITAAKEYATKLRDFSHQVADSFFVMMRVYFEKPRTKGGWKGLLSDPYLDGSHAIETGLHLARQLLLDLADLNMPAATEFLDPSTIHYLQDLICWSCIGARTVESQTHRQMASGLHMPVAFKNSTSGNISAAINGMLAASEPHHYTGINEEGHLAHLVTQGTADVHLVLRGAENKPNYNPGSIELALKLLQQAKLPLRLVVDCAHGNSGRNPFSQIEVFESVLNQFIQGNQYIRGIVLESNLFEGRQPFGGKLKYGVSLTDPCLDWSATQKLLWRGHQSFQNAKRQSCFSPELIER